jgi:hypothetical protein
VQALVQRTPAHEVHQHQQRHCINMEAVQQPC